MSNLSRKIKPHDLCYQCSKHGPDCLFGNLRIKNFNYETPFPNKKQLLSSRIEMNMLLNTKDVRKEVYVIKNTQGYENSCRHSWKK